ncbi:hypothetical protein [Geobacillus sp. TFV-3]|uniref:hypothetical protein n=1 Tax=Geobacillus sp. TFV-3 TaxID=1897059 RepID=UPI001357CDD7|nr:hypothetical protein [Geobacillus sp. TFV-3]KAF0995498.1 hypothetical protein BJQ97_02160 [Geobacillus sp. TFV-3]
MKTKGMIDNRQNGLVGDALKAHITKGSKLSIVAAHFTLYAFAELKKELAQTDEFRFICFCERKGVGRHWILAVSLGYITKFVY